MFLRLHLYLERFFLIVFLLSTINKLIIIIVINENIHDYNPIRKRKFLIVFDDMIEDIKSNKKFKAIVEKSFIRFKMVHISLVFITQSYFLFQNMSV